MKLKNLISTTWHLLFVVLILGFNLVLLFPETQIKMDLNDNVFAFVLINHANKLLDEIFHLPPSIFHLPLLLDHWVPEFAMGFPVFSYYQHVPHLTVVFLYRLISLTTPTSLMMVFNWFKYLMLSLFPLAVYYSGRKFELSKIASSGAALVSTLISTQYLYGTDYNALVFRGSGMFTQLWGIFFLPLALSSIYDSLKYNRGYLKSAILLYLTLNGHLVFGFIAILSTPILLISLILSVRWIGRSSLASYIVYLKRLFLILASSFLLLAYWLIPLILNANYQNKSLWDDLTKFNSYGALQVLKWLVSGQLFDNERFPILTILVAMGFFYTLYRQCGNKTDAGDGTSAGGGRGGPPSSARSVARTSDRGGGRQDPRVGQILPAYLPACLQVWPDRQKPVATEPVASTLFFPLLFLFWLILYFGRYTFGPLFDLLPLTEGLHGHRLINGVHFAGIFLIGLSIEWLFFLLSQKLKNPLLSLTALITLTAILLSPALKERYDYLKFNSYSIKINTALYEREEKDFQKILAKIKELGPGRINLGRPGNWGRNFYVGAFSAYFVATANNFDVIGFEPESWSPSTDIEQFFSEYDPAYYNLFNIRYIVAPPEEKFYEAPFAKKIMQSGKFVLYQVDTKGLTQNNLGNFEFINSDITIYTNKKIKLNADRLWLGSKLMPLGNHPAISYSQNPPTSPTPLKSLTMLDLANYKLGKPSDPGEILNLFAQNPFDTNYQMLNITSTTPSGSILSEKAANNFFSATVETPKDSILMLKASYHPFWHPTIDQRPATMFMVEPSFMAIKVPAGKHEVEFKYYPAAYKQILMMVSLLTLPALFFLLKRNLSINSAGETI